MYEAIYTKEEVKHHASEASQETALGAPDGQRQREVCRKLQQSYTNILQVLYYHQCVLSVCTAVCILLLRSSIPTPENQV